MEKQLPWIRGKTSVTDLPLTGAMREAITRQIGRQRRRRTVWLIVIWVVAFVFLLLLLSSPQFWFGVVVFITFAAVAYFTWLLLVSARRSAVRALAAGTFRRHIGWFLAPLDRPTEGARSTTYALQIADRTIRLSTEDAAPSFEHNAPRDEPLWAVLDFVEETGMVLVIWHARRGFIHTHALYDPEADAEWPKPETEAPAGPPPGREPNREWSR